MFVFLLKVVPLILKCKFKTTFLELLSIRFLVIDKIESKLPQVTECKIFLFSEYLTIVISTSLTSIVYEHWFVTSNAYIRKRSACNWRCTYSDQDLFYQNLIYQISQNFSNILKLLKISQILKYLKISKISQIFSNF